MIKPEYPSKPRTQSAQCNIEMCHAWHDQHGLSLLWRCGSLCIAREIKGNIQIRLLTIDCTLSQGLGNAHQLVNCSWSVRCKLATLMVKLNMLGSSAHVHTNDMLIRRWGIFTREHIMQRRSSWQTVSARLSPWTAVTLFMGVWMISRGRDSSSVSKA